jgi:hypothetical protein
MRPSKSVARLFCFAMSMGCTSCSRQTTGLGGAATCRGDAESAGSGGASPYLRRVYRGTPPENVVPKKSSLRLQHPAEQKCGGYFLFYDVNGGEHRVRDERLDWGVPPHARRRGKPRLRRSFALPAPKAWFGRSLTLPGESTKVR